LAQGDPRTFGAGAVFNGFAEDLFHLSLRHVMTIDVRLASVWILLESKFHRSMFTQEIGVHQGSARLPDHHSDASLQASSIAASR
jgi:hypothetical protein